MSLKKTLNNRIDAYIINNPKQSNETFTGFYNRIASLFDIHPEKARKRFRMIKAKTYVVPENTSTIEFHSEKPVNTVEQLINVMGVDGSKFDITHAQATKKPTKVGDTIKDIYHVKASLKAKKIDSSKEEQAQLILDEIRKAAPKFEKQITGLELEPFVTVDVSKRAIKDCALEINIPDLHIGKLAWGKESGEDYDIHIAIDRYKKAVKSLLARVNPLTLEKIILPIGNDMINVDNKANLTTGGTPQSCDSRFGKMFQTAKELLIDTINYLSQYAPVEVMVIPGNHDTVAMFTLGEVLDAWYHNNDKVTVINTHTPRKYLQYGQNLLMYVHGHNEKLQELGIICATEQPHLWAATKFRRVHVGHFHHAKQIKYNDVQEYPGFTVKVLNSLSANDAWHSEKGYMSLKGAEAFLYHKEKGLLANYYYLNQ